jgi:Matrixin
MLPRLTLRIKQVCVCSALALASANVASQLDVRPAYAFCQSTVCSGDDGNTCRASPDALKGKCPTKRWAQMPIPIRFHDRYSSKLFVPETKRALRAAMDRWSDVICKGGRTSLRFQVLPETRIDKPLVTPATDRQPGKGTEPFGVYFRETGWDNQDPDKVKQIAITHLFTGAADPAVRDADIVINSSDFVFALDEDPAQAAAGAPLGEKRVDLEATMTHEMGHYIGLAHMDRESLSMMAEEQCSADRCLPNKQVVARRLREDDELAVCTLYPPGRVYNNEDASSGCQVASTSASCAPFTPIAGLVAVALGLRYMKRQKRTRLS